MKDEYKMFNVWGYRLCFLELDERLIPALIYVQSVYLYRHLKTTGDDCRHFTVMTDGLGSASTQVRVIKDIKGTIMY